MCYAKAPYRAENHLDLLRKINTGKLIFPDQVTVIEPKRPIAGFLRAPIVVVQQNSDPNAQLPDSSFKDLVKRLLVKNPKDRLSFEDYFAHPLNIKPETLVINTANISIHSGAKTATVKQQLEESSLQSELPKSQSSSIHLKNSDSSSISDSKKVRKLSITNQVIHSSDSKHARKISVASPAGILLIDPPFKGYDMEPTLFMDAFDQLGPPTAFVNPIPEKIDQPWKDGSSEEFVNVDEFTSESKTPTQISFQPASTQYSPPPFITFNNTIVIPNELDIPYLPPTNPETHTINTLVLHAYIIQIFAQFINDNDSTGIYICALSIYTTALSLLKKDTELEAFIHDNYRTCIQFTSGVWSNSSDRIYYHAIKLAHSAGNNELIGQDLQGCEIAYEQSIVLLEALLDIQGEYGLVDEQRSEVEKLVVGLFVRVRAVRSANEETQFNASHT